MQVLWRLPQLMNCTGIILKKNKKKQGSLINTQAWESVWPHWPQHLVYSSKRSSSRSGKGSSPQKRSRSPSSSPERRQKHSRSRSSSGGRKRRRSRSRSSERFGFLWNTTMALIVVSQLLACLQEFIFTEHVQLCPFFFLLFFLASVTVLIRQGKCWDPVLITPLSSHDVHVIAGAVGSLLDPPVLVPVQKRNSYKQTVLKQ